MVSCATITGSNKPKSYKCWIPKNMCIHLMIENLITTYRKILVNSSMEAIGSLHAFLFSSLLLIVPNQQSWHNFFHLPSLHHNFFSLEPRIYQICQHPLKPSLAPYDKNQLIIQIFKEVERKWDHVSYCTFRFYFHETPGK